MALSFLITTCIDMRPCSLNGLLLNVKDLLMFLLITIPLHSSIKHEETLRDSLYKDRFI
jgi:hypothetical protein